MRLSIITSYCRSKCLFYIFLVCLLSNLTLSAQIIKTGNNLKVSILSHPELNRIYKVAEDGIIEIQNIGRIPVAGMSLENLQYIISEQYKKIMPAAMVSIEMTDEYEIQYEIYGAVKLPGRTKGTNFTTLQTALVMAGGVDENSNLNQITVMRDNSSLAFNLSQFLMHGELSQNPRIRNSDVIYVLMNTQKTRVQVFGEVARSGFYPFTQAMTLMDVLTLAGGLTREANQKKIRLVRFYNKVPIEKEINLQKIIKNRQYQLIPELEAGDLVIIEKRSEKTKTFFSALGSFSQQILMVLSLILTVQNLGKT